MRVPIYQYPIITKHGKVSHELVPNYLGYAEVDSFSADQLFHLCNWKLWAMEKPDNLNADILCSGHGLCFINPETKERWLSLSIGWVTATEAEISAYVIKNRNTLIWI